MLIVQIEGKEYKIVSEWSDITLQESLNILKESPPEGYYELITQDKDYKFSDKFWVKTLPVFYGTMIGYFSDIPKSIIEQMTIEQRTQIYAHIAKFVNELFYGEPEKIKEIKTFDFKGERYYLPEKITKLGLYILWERRRCRLLQNQLTSCLQG